MIPFVLAVSSSVPGTLTRPCNDPALLFTGFSDGIGRAFLRGVAYFSNVCPSFYRCEVSASRSNGAFLSL